MSEEQGQSTNEFLNPQEKEILDKIGEYLTRKKIPFMITSELTSMAAKDKDIDLCLAGDLSEEQKNLADLQKEFPNISWIGLMGGEVDSTSVIAPSPYQIYDSVGVASASIRGKQIDFISGYALKVWEEGKQIQDLDRVDFSLAIGETDFTEAINGYNFLSLPLMLLKHYLEIKYIEESSLEELEAGEAGETYYQKKIKNSCYANFQTGLDKLNDRPPKVGLSTYHRKLKPVQDFLSLQVRQGNITSQENANKLFAEFFDFCFFTPPDK
ncbi:hypothetical protein ACFLZ1_00110 [Patescibacteria group bacterium]